MDTYHLRIIWALAALCSLVVTVLPATADACTSGVIQLQRIPPPPPPQSTNDCFLARATPNSLKALCGVAFQVTLKAGLLKLTPLSQATYNVFGGGRFDCKQLNASGVFLPGSTTDARITLYDNIGGPLTNLTKTGANQVTLAPGKESFGPGPKPNCRFNYTVISGCVLGIKAPAKPPACPSGYFLQSGAGKAKFCAPCPAGTSSKGPDSASCTPCPAGTINPYLGGSCKPCPVGTYASRPGSDFCQDCAAVANRYSDGKSCKPCPAGSFTDRLNQGRCVKCVAGRKCCTVGAGAGCPACKPGAKPTPATSTFALVSATPATCLASTQAFCAPAFSIALGGDCQFTVTNRGYPGTPPPRWLSQCLWTSKFPMRGATPSIPADLGYVSLSGTAFGGSQGFDAWLLAGNATKVTPPHLDFTIPATKCTLRYRALTKPVAALLGATPQPSKPGTCPRGQYRYATTDTPPGPCLPCPPGSYGSAPGACTPCKAGTYAGTYGALACTACPRYQVSGPNAASCYFCDGFTYPGNKTACSRCPRGTSHTSSAYGNCLANAGGNICCAAGDCLTQPKCGTLPPWDPLSQQKYPAVLQVTSLSSSDAACRNATILKCLRPNDLVAFTSDPGMIGHRLDLMGRRCPTNTDSYQFGYTVDIITPSRATVTGESLDVNDSRFIDFYELLSTASQNVITMSLSRRTRTSGPITTTPSTIPACSATLRLVAGHTLDLTPPPSAACPPAGFIPTPVNGRTFCTFCTPGTFRPATAAPAQKCTPCPAGTYSNTNGAAACTACPPGAYCPAPGAEFALPCPPGSAAAKARQTQCTACPANTYSNRPSGATGCLPCAKGQSAPQNSSACNVPF